MLTDEQVLPTCFYWAKRLATKNVPFQELVNEGYIVGKKLKSPLLLQKWVKWTMVHFLTNNKPVNTIPDEFDVADTTFDFEEFGCMQEELIATIESVCSEEDKKLLYLLFWAGMTYREAAKHLNVSDYQGVFYRVQRILRELKKEYEKRSKR